MTIEMNNARLLLLRKYNGTIGIEGENEDEIVVRIRSNQHITEQIYNSLISATED